MTCCCNHGAAVSGEFPEFPCVDCERHGAQAVELLGHDEHRCKRHCHEALQRVSGNKHVL